MIRIDDERGEMWCSSSILSFREIEWEREARRAAAVVLLFSCVPGMTQVLRVKVPSRVFTAKCSEPQAENSNV